MSGHSPSPCVTCDWTGSWWAWVVVLVVVLTLLEASPPPPITGAAASESHGTIENSVTVISNCCGYTRSGMAGEL